jgi:type I restriction enzyme S subunit
VNLETFHKHFDLLADAPNAVQKMRELVLELAVRGKLVEQVSSEGPAAELLQSIREQMLARSGRLVNATTTQVRASETLYAIPSGWRWVKLSEVGHNWGQKQPEGGFTYIDVSSIDKERGVISEDVAVVQAADAPSRARKLVKVGTVIYSTVRPYLLNIAVIDKLFEPEPIASTAFAIIHPYDGVLNRYVYYYLRSRPFVEYVQTQMSGMAYPAINDKKFFGGVIPLPPTNEQKRIVAKVDELMALCDDLEAKQEVRNRARLTLNTAALGELQRTGDASAFKRSWGRVSRNFDLLYSTPENIVELRKAILQLAVQGKLVRQNPNDEPASKLLAEIQAKNGRTLKRDQPINLNKTWIDIPKGWQWARLADLGTFMGGGTPSKLNSGYWNGGIPWVSPKDMKQDRVSSSELTVSPKALEETSIKLIPEESLLIVARSGILRRRLPVAINEVACTVNQDIKVVVPFSRRLTSYLQLMLKGHESLVLTRLVKTGTTVQSLKYDEFEQQPFPLPPLNG